MVSRAVVVGFAVVVGLVFVGLLVVVLISSDLLMSLLDSECISTQGDKSKLFTRPLWHEILSLSGLSWERKTNG